MMKFIFLEGCKRSGNHAVIQWVETLVSNQGDSWGHHNNAFYNVKEQFDGNTFNERQPGYNKQLSDIITFFNNHPRLTYGIVSHEHPGLLSPAHIQNIVSSIKINCSASHYQYLHLIRDPFNWMASFTKLVAGVRVQPAHENNKCSATFEEVETLYGKMHTEYWLRWLRSFDLWKRLPENEKIFYNNFISSLEIRKQLADILNLEWNDEKDKECQSKMPSQGSSFDEPEHLTQKNVLVENVKQRYKYALPLFTKFEIPSEVWEAADELCPEISNKVKSELKNC